MKIGSINTNISFKRAFTTQEKKDYKALEKEARKALGIEETSVIFFDFNAPSRGGQNVGIGTLNSRMALEFTDFLKENASISKIQTGPESQLAYKSKNGELKPVTSPYSGSTFTFGIQTIALERLCRDEYGSILDWADITRLDEKYPKNRHEREYKTDYDYVLGKNQDGVLFKTLEKAYSNFNKKVENGNLAALQLNKEFENYTKIMSEDIKKDLLFDTLISIYHKKGVRGDNPKNWSYPDCCLFDSCVDSKTREDRIKEIQETKTYKFFEFAQFIAQKQHNETRKSLNDKGIKLYGDCLVCYSAKEVWGNPDCFLKGWYTGGIDPFCPETNNIQPWGSPALDYKKLGRYKDSEIVELGKTGELLYRKFRHFMENYDGVRMDAFWQYISPFIYNDDLEGKNIKDIDTKIIKIMEKAAKDSGNANKDRFVLELIGYNTEKGKKLTTNVFPHVYSTAYAEYNENPHDLIHRQGYKDGNFIIGACSHDNDSMVNLSRNHERRFKHYDELKRNLGEGLSHLEFNSNHYQEQSQQRKIEQDYRTAKFAEIFIAKKQYFTLNDMFGMEERINISGKADENNWSVRIPSEYERFYHKQLTKGYGINFPKSMEVALYAKGCKNKKLLEGLKDASEILAKEGPLTTSEADFAQNNGNLGRVFRYNA